MGGKGYKPRKDYAGRTVSGDWEDSDRGAGNKAKKRAGGTVKKKSPTYLAHVHNKEEVELTEAPGVGTAIKYGGKWVVRQGIKVGGKKGGYAVKKAGKAAVAAGKEVAHEAGRGAVKGITARKDELVKKAGEAGERLTKNIGRPVAVETARRKLKDDEKPKSLKQANESVAAPAKKPVGKGEKIGKFVGGIGGSIGGGVAGSAAMGTAGSVVPGAGTVAGGLAGGVAGSLAGGEVGEKIGGAIGKKFDRKKKPMVKKESFSDWRTDLGEEGYDRMRDARLVKYGIGHDGSDRLGSKSRSTMRPTGQKLRGKTVLQKETEKKYGKGVSALDVVKKQIEDKHGKGAIYDGKKK